MTLDHDVIFPEDFYVLQEVMVGFFDLMIHILLKKLNELKRILHNPQVTLSSSLGFGLRTTARLQIFVFDFLVKSLVQCIAEHKSLQDLACLSVKDVSR